MSAVLDAIEAVPIAKGEPKDAVPMMALVSIPDEIVQNGFLRGSREAGVFLVPDDATIAAVGFELATLPNDQKLQLVAPLHDSLDGGKTWEHVTTLFYSGTGSKFLPSGQPHTDPKAWGTMRKGTGRLLRCTYTPVIDVLTSISVVVV